MVGHQKPQLLRPSKTKIKPKSQIQDDYIMGTNNSSIVSKRSVERLYFPDEPHYFRFFVKKPQRRAPLINRGYWLRMKAIDHVVRQFLEAPSKKKKVVINLGCGYDPLPWQCLSRYPAACGNVKFIDIDYKDLMLKKRDVVQNTHELFSKFSNVEPKTGEIMLRSDQYLQVGCDLRDLHLLEKTLESVLDLQNCFILFTAEVSITYMNVQAADALIKWVGTLPEARFCLLEQLLPDGIGNPFAQMMMAHFAKLQTPLGAVQTYPTTDAQEKRFRDLGWPTATATNLWQLWSSPEFLTSRERRALDAVEPFDEWEEFALFGYHYLLLVADNTRNLSQVKVRHTQSSSSRGDLNQTMPAGITYSENPKTQGLRRFGAALSIKVSKHPEYGIGNFAGMGANSRMASYDIYASGQARYQPKVTHHSGSAPFSRMCHTITDLGDIGSLLVGGRTSPENALADCWVYHKFVNFWERVEDLPVPQYRHSALHLGQGRVLVSPGRINSRESGHEFLVWSRHLGWRTCSYGSDVQPSIAYGAVFSIFDDTILNPIQSGLLAGGLSEDGTINENIWEWYFYEAPNQKPIINFEPSSSFSNNKLQGVTIARFGATTINHNGRVFVVGGVVKNDLLEVSNEICYFSASSGDPGVTATMPISLTKLVPRPLLIGVSVASKGDSLIILGGSAVCFSFGTYWNKGCFTFHTRDSSHEQRHIKNDDGDARSQWQYCGISEVVAASPSDLSSPALQTPGDRSVVFVPRVKIQSTEEFSRLIRNSEPVIIEGSNIGPCTEKWTTDYLKEQIGADRKVVIHEGTSEHLDFLSKNFSYVTKTFGAFIDQAANGGQVYLRSLSLQNPSKLPTNIRKDYPSIADDFCLPTELAIVLENLHSSPLRISGPVTMWLHYDVMANVLCQVRGSKRLMLFPPSDVKHLGFEASASSSKLNVFDRIRREGIPGTHPYEVTLHPGDVLFLPPLWLHTASPTSGLSIAVNVFFRNLQAGYAAGKDVYGNRDLQAYEKGRQDISKIIKTFEGLPLDVREFYLSRLAQEFAQLAS